MKISRFILSIYIVVFSFQWVNSQEKLIQERKDSTEISVFPKILPEIKSEFQEGTYTYIYIIETGGQSIPMEMTRIISKSGENWVVRDHAKSQFGDVIDEVEFSSNFQPIRRNLEQGGANAPITFLEDKVKLKMNGETLEFKMDGQYIADGAGLDLIIAGFPIEPNYTLDFFMPDVILGKSKAVTLKVDGIERLNDIECWIVKLTNKENLLDEITFCFNPFDKSVLKMTQINPIMGDVKFTTLKK